VEVGDTEGEGERDSNKIFSIFRTGEPLQIPRLFEFKNSI
jgi:hypothetical protein